MKRLISLVGSLLVVASVLSPGPVNASVTRVESPQLAEPAPSPERAKAQDRAPVEAPQPEDGLRNPQQVTLDAAPTQTPRKLLEEAKPLPARGGPNYDVYAVPGGGEHYAVLFPQDVNVEDADGRWVKAAEALATRLETWVGELDEGTVSCSASSFLDTSCLK